MKATHLKTLSARIDEISSLYYESDDERFLSFYMNTHNYNGFLKQPLTLSQFVACDENGKPLNKPCEHDGCYLKTLEEAQKGECAAKSCTCKELKTYHKAQQNVIFEGWEVVEDTTFDSGTRVVEIRNSETKLALQFYYNGGYDGTIGISKGQLREDNKNTLSDLAAATIENPLKLK